MASLKGDIINAGKVFKCHPKTSVPKIVICIICKNEYYEGDFNKLIKGKYVGKMLVIYPNHNHEDLTSKKEYDVNTLDENAREMIMQIKMHHKYELRNELCNNITLKKTKNLSDVSDLEIDEIAALKMENELLRQLNT